MGSSARKPAARYAGSAGSAAARRGRGRGSAAAAADPTSQPTPPGEPTVGQLASLSGLAAVVGLAAALAVSVFVKVEHVLQHWLWVDLPEALGHQTPPAWLTVVLLLTGALVVAAALRLPGHGGHAPLADFALDIGPRQATSVVLAALGSLSFGAVLGPEAPLLAIGTAVGAAAMRGSASPTRQVMMLAGGMAGIGAIFGNPLVTAILLLELAVLSRGRLSSPTVLVPCLAALAAGYELQVGFESWSGIGESRLGVPGLPSYATVQAVDLITAVPLALVVAVVAIGARLAGMRVARAAAGAPVRTLLATAVVVAACAIAVDTITDQGVDVVVFSGQAAIPQYLALTSVGTAAVILVGKFVAYAACLGGGFRGGSVFPAIAMGLVVAAAAAQVVDAASISALAAAGIAAATAAPLRAPFLATALGALLTLPAGGATTVLAVIGTVVGLLTRYAAETRIEGLRPPPA